MRQLSINQVLSSRRSPRDRPSLTCLPMIEQDLSRINMDVISAVHATEDRAPWRSLTTTCCATLPLFEHAVVHSASYPPGRANRVAAYQW